MTIVDIPTTNIVSAMAIAVYRHFKQRLSIKIKILFGLTTYVTRA
jgi:hypothetical protein